MAILTKENQLKANDMEKEYTFINGDTFEGGFINDIRHGKGIYTWVNGDFEEQDYIQGKKINFRTK